MNRNLNMKHLLLLFLFLPLISTAQIGLKEQRLYVSDSFIVNTTELRLYSLFNSTDSSNKNFRFKEELDGNVIICGSKKKAIIYAGGISFQIQPNGIFIDTLKNTSCKKGIDFYSIRGSRRVKELDNGEVEITFDLDKKHMQSEVGMVEISPQELHCDDTGSNPFRIISKDQAIVFKQGGNLILFEYDSNHDQKKELYIVNYFSCMKRLEVYKVE